MRAFIYCRVSTDEQSTEEQYSLENREKHDPVFGAGTDGSALCADLQE